MRAANHLNQHNFYTQTSVLLPVIVAPCGVYAVATRRVMVKPTAAM